MPGNDLEVLSHYKREIEKNIDNEEILLRSLAKLGGVRVNIALLRDTGIGRTVSLLKKKYGDQEIGTKSRDLLTKWKEVVAREESDEDREEVARSDEEAPEVEANDLSPHQAHYPGVATESTNMDVVEAQTNRPQRTNQLAYMKNVVLKGLWKHQESRPFRGSSRGFEASINLETIKSKMENFDYLTSAEAIQDFKTMFSDCSLLYKPQEDIFNMGNALEKFFWARMKGMPKEEKILNGAKAGHSSNQVQQLSTVINGTAETHKRKREEKRDAERENKRARVDSAAYCLLCQQGGHEMSTECATCLACGGKGHVRKDCDAPKVVKSEGENMEQNGHGKDNRSSDKMEVKNDELKHENDAEGNVISINKREEDDGERIRESDDREKDNNKTRESNPSSDVPRSDGCSSSPNDLHNEIEILHRQVADCVKKRLDMYMVGQAGTEPKNIKIKDSDEYTRLAKFFSHKLRAQIKETYEQYNRTLKGVAITADNKEQIKVEIDMYFDTQPVVV